MQDPAATAVAPIPVSRISLGRELRLRDLPPLLSAVARAVEAGVTRVELDASLLGAYSLGARELLQVAQARLRDHQVELVIVAE